MPTMTGVITGGAQVGFTSPTYTLTADNNPTNNGKQSIVTALGGTQAGVTSHAASDPFTVSAFKPLVYKILNLVSTTMLKKPPKNTYKVLVRKGVTYLPGQPKDVLLVSLLVDVPQGCESNDAANVKAAISLATGFLSGTSSEFGQNILIGTI